MSEILNETAVRLIRFGPGERGLTRIHFRCSGSVLKATDSGRRTQNKGMPRCK
jgi:hypothetical protein